MFDHWEIGDLFMVLSIMFLGAGVGTLGIMAGSCLWEWITGRIKK